MDLGRENFLISIKLEIKTISQFLETLNSCISFETYNLLPWFRELCGLLTKLLVFITNLHRKFASEMENGEILLYLNQLLTSLSLLINIFVKEADAQLKLTLARDFCIKQMKWCLDGIKDTLMNTYYNKDTGSFIKWMDLALHKMNEIDFENRKDNALFDCYEAKGLFEEVLSHAMSIAQVALVEDCKIIRGRSRAVLEALDGLTNEINKVHPNTPMINLFVETCSNELCALERRVNTAVLKLSLKVFSEYTFALESIHSFCFNRNNIRKLNELDTLVMEYDLHVDRMMQIGLFAVSCSTCTKNCTKIKSCLASLEALETELVPLFTSFLQDPSPSNLQQTLLLEEHWLNQARILRTLIFLIIDPFAFCQVIYEENKELLETISDKIKATNSFLDKERLEKLIKQSMVLEEFINVILEEQQGPSVIHIKKEFQDFKNVLHELSAASLMLPEEKTNNLRILKRGNILQTTIKKLWNCFLQDDGENKSSSSAGNFRTLEELQIDERDDICLLGNPFLDHIINRGKQILKDSSILNQNSLKSDSFNKFESSIINKISQMKGICIFSPKLDVTAQLSIFGVLQTLLLLLSVQLVLGKSLPLSRLIHLRKLSFMSSVIKNDSCLELQMTDIVNELNNITISSLGTSSLKSDAES